MRSHTPDVCSVIYKLCLRQSDGLMSCSQPSLCYCQWQTRPFLYLKQQQHGQTTGLNSVSLLSKIKSLKLLTAIINIRSAAFVRKKLIICTLIRLQDCSLQHTDALRQQTKNALREAQVKKSSIQDFCCTNCPGCTLFNITKTLCCAYLFLHHSISGYCAIYEGRTVSSFHWFGQHQIQVDPSCCPVQCNSSPLIHQRVYFKRGCLHGSGIVPQQRLVSMGNALGNTALQGMHVLLSIAWQTWNKCSQATEEIGC